MHSHGHTSVVSFSGRLSSIEVGFSPDDYMNSHARAKLHNNLFNVAYNLRYHLLLILIPKKYHTLSCIVVQLNKLYSTLLTWSFGHGLASGPSQHSHLSDAYICVDSFS